MSSLRSNSVLGALWLMCTLPLGGCLNAVPQGPGDGSAQDGGLPVESPHEEEDGGVSPEGCVDRQRQVVQQLVAPGLDSTVRSVVQALMRRPGGFVDTLPYCTQDAPPPTSP